MSLVERKIMIMITKRDKMNNSIKEGEKVPISSPITQLTGKALLSYPYSASYW